MAKSNSFSIYLLKPNIFGEDALNEGHSLRRIGPEHATKLPDGAELFVSTLRKERPWWAEYFDIQGEKLPQSSANGILFIKAGEHGFAITFGSAYHSLKENSYEYDFGMIATLNAIDPKKIKSTDILTPETAQRRRIQTPTASDLTLFDFNSDESILRKLAGAVKEDFADLFKNISGASNVRIATKSPPDELERLCSRLFEIYSRKDYEEIFPDLLNIAPTKDPAIVSQLEGKLVDSLRNGFMNIALALPDMFDPSEALKVNYQIAGRTSEDFDDVCIADYKEFLQKEGLVDINIEALRKHRLRIINEDGQKKESYTIYKTFLFDCQYDEKVYHLCEGDWYEIKKDFIDRLKEDLDKYFIDSHDVLCEYDHGCEKEYNESVVRKVPKKDVVFCLDGKSIAPRGQTSVEPCDVATLSDGRIELIHNKISMRSGNLSHLFNQGVNSAILLWTIDESKEKLIELVDRHPKLTDCINKGLLKVTYGIISPKESGLKSDALPIFSRISLHRSLRDLKSHKIPASVFLIKSKKKK